MILRILAGITLVLFCALALVAIACESVTEPRASKPDQKQRDDFFMAWAANYVSGPIHIQAWSGPGQLDARLSRQLGSSTADAEVLAFAAAHPGRLYIHWDEPDQNCVSPSDYAAMYHDFTTAILKVDPTARFSPAGFAEPNTACCEGKPDDCFETMHFTGYAEQFLQAYISRYGVRPPVDEWRFHDFGMGLSGNIAAWWARVSSAAAWSVSNGANMVLGSWGFLDWDEPPATFQAHMREAMDLLCNDPRINGAVWWSYENTGFPHHLSNSDGTLTPEGQTYAMYARGCAV